MSGIDLSLPDTVPEMARYQDRPMTLDSFAVYNLLDPHNEPPGLVEKCNSECPRDDYVYFRASPGVDSLKGLIDHHLSTTVHEGFDPNLFLAVTDPDWEQNGVCVVTLGDDEGKPDKFIMKTEESGLLLVNLQIANTDWYEAKENAEYTGDDDTHDLESGIAPHPKLLKSRSNHCNARGNIPRWSLEEETRHRLLYRLLRHSRYRPFTTDP